MTNIKGSGLLRGASTASAGGSGGAGCIKFQDNPGPGFSTAWMSYNTHTEIWYQNGLVGEVWGAQKGSRPSFSSLWGWVNYTTYPGGYVITHAPGYHWDTHSGSLFNYDGGYLTNGFAGATRPNTSPSGTPGAVDDSWLLDLGLQTPIPGHEDHTGGFPVVLATGDLEKRTFYKARWASNVPQTILSARVFASTFFGNLPGGGFGRITDYDINVDAYSQYTLDVGDPDTAPFVTSYLLQGECPYDAAADPDSFSEIMNIPTQSSNTYLASSNLTLNVGNGIDLGMKHGQLGNLGSANLTDRYCNLDHFGDPFLADGVEYRWPSTPIPAVDYLYCPFHFGLVFLDGYKRNHIQVSDGSTWQIGGVEVTFQTAPGWGWDTANKYEWLDRDQNSSGPDLTAVSSSSSAGGVLEVFPVFGEEMDRLYGYRSAVVEADYNDLAQRNTPSIDWAWEFVCKIEGGTTGDEDYPTYFEASMGLPFISIETNLDRYSFNFFNYHYDINLRDWFHVRMYQTAGAWGVKVWQDGDPVPTAYTHATTGVTYSTYCYPYFELWQDAGLWFTPYNTSYAKVTISSYSFWDLTGSPDKFVYVSPGVGSGGNIDETLGPCSPSSLSTDVPPTIAGNGLVSQ